jgi:hypothetical protein
MVAMTKARGIAEDMTVAAVFLVLAALSTALLILFLRSFGSPKKR